jgi:threonine/homoserine efflux transporter RhtA
MTKNWKTTLAGVVVALIAGATYLGYLNAEQAVAVTGTLTALGLIAAEDAKK